MILRQIEDSDAVNIFKHRSNKIVNTFLDGFIHTSLDETISFISRIKNEVQTGKTILWVLTQKGDNQFMGTVCFWNLSLDRKTAETGYSLEPEFQNQGFMNEALSRIIDYGFKEMRLQTIVAYTHEKNIASIRLLERNKFIQSENSSLKVGRKFFKLTKNI